MFFLSSRKTSFVFTFSVNAICVYISIGYIYRKCLEFVMIIDRLLVLVNLKYEYFYSIKLEYTYNVFE